MTPSLLSPFEENNHRLVPLVRARLVGLCAERPLHARFLNMLSLLEHIGSRKINIHNMLNKSRQDMAYTLVDVDSAVSRQVIDRVGAIAGVLAVHYLPESS